MIQIDSISENILKLIYFLENSQKGSIDSIWLPEKITKKIKENLPQKIDFEKASFAINSEISLINNYDRKIYLNGLTNSILYQIQLSEGQVKFNFSEFNKNCFGLILESASEIDIKRIDDRIIDLETRLKKSRYEVISKKKVQTRSIKKNLLAKIKKQNNLVFPELKLSKSEVSVLVGKKRFNDWRLNHKSLFNTELVLNSNFSFIEKDLTRIAIMASIGGAHTFLSLQDNLVKNNSRGELGLLLKYSPRMFILNGIQQYLVYKLNSALSTREERLYYYYQQLINAIQSKAIFLLLERKISINDIKKRIEGYDILENHANLIMQRITNKDYHKLTHLPFSAYNFFNSQFMQSEDKNKFIIDSYTKALTPNMLISKY